MLRALAVAALHLQYNTKYDIHYMLTHRIAIISLLIYLLPCLSASGQEYMYIPQTPDSFNLYNDKNQKQGFWLYKAQDNLDGFSYNEYGYYYNDKKQGTWVKYDGLGRPVAIENYRNDVLDGESSYFDKGLLTLKANFRGLNTDQKYDTITVVNPVDLEEIDVIVPTERGTTRHGVWKYYNPITGAVIRIEEYQVDSLISRFDYYISEKEDKAFIEKMNQELPHNYSDKKIRYINRKYRQSLIK